MKAFLHTQAGAEFIERCQELGIEIEYELHAMRHLLPRDLFRFGSGALSHERGRRACR